jgi:hypothetical protein
MHPAGTTMDAPAGRNTSVMVPSIAGAFCPETHSATSSTPTGRENPTRALTGSIAIHASVLPKGESRC